MEKTIPILILERKIAELTAKKNPDANAEISNLLCNLGRHHLDLGNNDEAVKTFKKAIVATPDNPNVHSDMGTLLSTIGREPEAIESYLAALQLCPTHIVALQNLASIRYQQKKFEEAELLCVKAIEANSSNATSVCSIAHEIMAKITYAQGKKKVSMEHYQKSIQRSDGKPATHSDLMRVVNAGLKKKKAPVKRPKSVKRRRWIKQVDVSDGLRKRRRSKTIVINI